MTETDILIALWYVCSPEGGWPRLPQSRRHDADAWDAYMHLVAKGFARPTGDVRGDRTRFVATERGRALFAARRTKPRIRISATAHEKVGT